MGAGAGAELVRTVARSDVGRGEPGSQRAPGPPDRSRDRQAIGHGHATAGAPRVRAGGPDDTVVLRVARLDVRVTADATRVAVATAAEVAWCTVASPSATTFVTGAAVCAVGGAGAAGAWPAGTGTLGWTTGA